MNFQAVLILCLSIVQPFFCYDEMDSSENPILEYLGLKPNSVSEHELVKIDLSERSHKRGVDAGTPMSFRAFSNDFNLWLRPIDPTFVSDETPVYFANYVPGKKIPIEYAPVRDAMKNVGRILQDPNHLASLVLGSNDSGRRTVTGYLRSRRDNSSLLIRSLPGNVVERYLRKRRSIDDFNDDFTDSTHHVVLKLKNDPSENDFIEKICSSRVENDESSSDLRKNDGKMPGILYPEILVNVDYSHQKDLSRLGINRFLEYLLIFWNTVNLTYRPVKIPMFKLNIAGIIIATHPQAMPFIANNMLKEDGFDIDKVQYGSVDFYNDMKEVFPYHKYDLIVTLTRYSMGKNGVFGYRGVASSTGVCSQSSAALIHDNGQYYGLHSASHEIAHLLSADHDGDGNNCSPDNGFIMSTTSTKQTSSFSPCSLNSFQLTYKAGKFSCMYNVPVIKGAKWPIKLPGKVVSLADQCLAADGGPPCPALPGQDICSVNSCFTKDGQGCFEVDGALPGSPCFVAGNGKPGICLANRCVSV